MTEQAAMERALKLAREGWGRVHPNPMVGAVILKDGELVGQGAHREYGGPHAEIAALRDAGERAAGSTCVVTLEPCAHHGKTPPCTDALIEAGVHKVIFAASDPTSNAGGGCEKLERAGVVVEVGLMAEQAAQLNAPFFAAARRKNVPFVAVKLATSLDGFLADQHGSSEWISGNAARDWVHWLRAGFEAIGVGRMTAEKDDPALTVRGPIQPRIPPTRVIFTGSGNIPDTLSIFKTDAAPTILVTSQDHVARLLDSIGNLGAEVLGAADLVDALKKLRARGLESLLIEGGGRLAGSLMRANLVDRLYWIQAPIWLGTGVPAFPESPGTDLGNAPRWHVVERQGLGDDTLLVVDREICLPEL